MLYLTGKGEFIKEDLRKNIVKYIFIIPGVSKEDLDIHLSSDDKLIINIKETKYVSQQSIEKYIPVNTKIEDIKANVSNGILTIEMPLPTLKRIKID